jgi:threonine 3-dehydrogenase
MAAAIAQHVGARYVVVTDLNQYRLGLARKLGADRVVDAASADLKGIMDELGMSEGFDVGMEMSGSEEAFNQLLAVMNHGGGVAVLGLPPDLVTIDLGAVIFKGLTLKGIYGRLIFETWYKMAALLQGGLDVSPVISHRFPIARFEEAFATSASGQSGKVLLEWTE